jgi:protein arginine kinase activator
MLCDNCNKNEAVIRFAEIRQGTMRVRNICDDCARATGIADQLDRTIASLSGDAPACPGCGMTIDEFRRQGHLGCERCFETFAAVLTPLLERLYHPDGRCGAAAPAGQERQLSQNRGPALEQRLREAVANEEYELAARLRDELKELKTAAAEHAGPGPQTTSSAHNP